ncbi:hypothetical protein EDC18_103343 [Natranaerovirga pectinivora]|uniref:Uncharacterized protein n=1 Tax=Natranaerovirga pectinivora TaxID=682400 RepID=A0A4R3MMZ3_9FIRM|nr:hypothetical protein [Natranaerovirga pectinivora]TCT15635.1 hypothetical protein EDC18_103343 [Natranaerovirga pectinivora]
MSSYQFLASNKPLKEVTNSFVKLLSINDMIANNMEIPDFLLKTTKDRDEKIVLQCDSEEHLDEIEIMNENSIQVGYLKKYTNKKYISSLTWRYTDKRAEELLQYIKDQLKDVDEIELWDTWMDEKIEEPIIRELNIQDLTVQLIKESVGKGCYGKPSCLKITIKNLLYDFQE